LQPLVLGIGQAAGMAAALCSEQHCQPRHLSVHHLQNALIQDPTAPTAVIPLLNVPPSHPEWQHWQTYYLDRPESYPTNGYTPITPRPTPVSNTSQTFTGTFLRHNEQDYSLQINEQSWQLVTLRAIVDAQLLKYQNKHNIIIQGQVNISGNWILVEAIVSESPA
jgi:hypothetical protein